MNGDACCLQGVVCCTGKTKEKYDKSAISCGDCGSLWVFGLLWDLVACCELSEQNKKEDKKNTPA